MKPSVTLVFLLFLLTAHALGAGSLETRPLFRKGNWEVDLIYDADDGTLSCAAGTSNRREQTMALIGHEQGWLMILFTDPRWRLKEREVSFLVDVDYSRWEIMGHANGRSVAVIPGNAAKAARFFRELKKGFAVALMNAEGRRLAVFSLKGSAASLGKFLECWQAIVVNGADPFGDPPRSRADPF